MGNNKISLARLLVNSLIGGGLIIAVLLGLSVRALITIIIVWWIINKATA